MLTYWTPIAIICFIIFIQYGPGHIYYTTVLYIELLIS